MHLRVAVAFGLSEIELCLFTDSGPRTCNWDLSGKAATQHPGHSLQRHRPPQSMVQSPCLHCVLRNRGKPDSEKELGAWTRSPPS